MIRYALPMAFRSASVALIGSGSNVGEVEPCSDQVGLGEKVAITSRCPRPPQAACGRFSPPPPPKLVLLDTPWLQQTSPTELIGRCGLSQKCPRCIGEVDLGAVLVVWQ